MRGFDNYCKRGFPRGDKRVKRGSPWEELAPARATERGLQSVGI